MNNKYFELTRSMKNLTDRRNNCLNTIRLIAALQVAYGHIVAHLRIPMPEVLGEVFGYFQGVPIFFLLSGFLIWDSIGSSKSYSTYLNKRFWRIYPELWCGVAVEVIAIIILYGVSNVRQFILFIGTQATIFQFWTPDFLRGYGCGTPNGSLWTIGVLIQFYVVAWFMRKLLHGKGYVAFGVAFAISIALGMVPVLITNIVPEVIVKLYDQTLLNYLYLFFAGAFLAEFRDKILKTVVRYWYAITAIAIVFYVVGVDIPFESYDIVKNVLSIYGLIGFAYAFPQLNIKTDISYGLYINHMTVVNAMIVLGLTGKISYFFVAVIISIVLGWVSTNTIGEWSAKKKSSRKN